MHTCVVRACMHACIMCASGLHTEMGLAGQTVTFQNVERAVV